MKRIRSVVLVPTLLAALASLVIGGCSAVDGREPRYAQAGGQHCNVDTDCHIALPRARVCPHGGQSVPTACCRMNYCGVCWSDCPQGQSTSDSPPLAL